MRRTKHFDQRMNQRGIRNAWIPVIFLYGKKDGSRVTMDRRICQMAREEIKAQLKIIDSIEKGGGWTIVTENDCLITAYRVDSYSRSLANRKN